MIITSKNKNASNHPCLGGKGKNLLRLKHEGFDVPDFVILPSTSVTNKAVSNDIIDEAISHFPANTLFAVRSSADVEDGNEYSFAGQFKSFLNVPPDEVKTAVYSVLSSKESPEVLTYIKDKQLASIEMSVIIQEMVSAECSGVAFGINPTTGDEDEVVINAIEGLGESLVSGQANADCYIIVKNKETIHHIINKDSVLSNSQIKEISNLLYELASFFGQPQDVEFAYQNGKLKLLQARPITTQLKKDKIVYDNSNIIESYPGMTMPLTFSFLEKMYAAVYKQLSAVLGISTVKIKQHSNEYDNMLGLLNGRVYYNLNSWYKVLALLPGYNLNAEFMETMMGVKTKPDIIVRKHKAATVKDYLDIAKAMLYIMYNAITVQKQKKTFVIDFHQIYDLYNKRDYSKRSLRETFEDYQTFETLMSSKWKAPLVNDFFAMIYFGVLQKFCSKYFPGQKGLHNNLVSSTKDIITTQPLILLPKLAKVLIVNNEIRGMLEHKSATYVWKQLQKKQYSKERLAIEDYVDKWGERCVAELKLETITYKQDPVMLITVLQSYVRKKITSNKLNTTEYDNCYTLVLQKLKGHPLRKLLFKYILRKTRYLVSNRENLRYYRTLGFGLVRTMMLNIGTKLANQDMINDKRDIFYLRLEQLTQTIQKNETTDLKEKIASNKKNYQIYHSLDLPERVITDGTPQVIITSSTEMSDKSCTELKGIPCSGGVVSATVRKITSVKDEMPDKQIMATYATDPGYVVMFPTATGILTERGSLLSHAAIVSREMNIPCIVGIEGLMQQLKDGDEIIMDGSTGIVKIIKRNA